MNRIRNYFSRFFARRWYVIAGDLVFWIILIMLILPPTRTVIFSGMATVRAWVMPLARVSDAPDGIHDREPLEWFLITPGGEELSLADLHGEVILVNQWATWCPPCRAEMPSLQRLYERMGDRVKFVMVTPEEPEVVQEYMTKKGYTFPVYLTGHRSPPELATGSIPATHIIDRLGRVVVMKKGAYNWNTWKVRRLLEQLLND